MPHTTSDAGVTLKCESTLAEISRLHALDAEFLLIEDERSPMCIGSLCVFEGPVPSRDECEQFVASRLGLIPAYRRRMRAVPLGLGRPVLIDDVQFDIAYHVRRTSLPAPCDEAALWDLMGTLMARPLDRRRPLWQMFIVEGMPEERWAMIVKVHHALVDGVAGIGVLAAVLSDRSEVAPIEPATWSPAEEPSRPALVQNALAGVRDDARAWVKEARAAVKHPRRALVRGREIGTGLYEFVRRLVARRTSSLQGQVHERRRYASVQVDLDAVRRIREAFHCTVNDVILTLLSGGYRAVLECRGDDLRRVRLRSLVPVSVRATDTQRVEGNRVSAVLCELPVWLKDPHARLDAVVRHMKHAKSSHMVEAGVWFTDIADLAPPPLVRGLSHVIVRGMHWIPQNTFSTVTTNVPGPQFPLYLRGRRMLSWSPYVPITQGARIGSAALSYNHTLAIGVTADYDSVPHLDLFLRAVEADLQALLARVCAPAREVPP